MVKFKDVEHQIKDKLEVLLEEQGIKEDVTLLNGFLRVPLEPKSDYCTIGGPQVETVGLKGETGRLYFFVYRELGIDESSICKCKKDD